MTNTIRTQSELLDTFADNISGNITPQDMRDFVVSTNIGPVSIKNTSDRWGYGSWSTGYLSTNRANSQTNGNFTGVYYSNRIARTAVNGASLMRFLYVSTYKSTFGENILPNGMYVKASIEYPVGTATPIPLFFNGRRLGILDGGGELLSDPSGPVIPAGGVFYERVTWGTAIAPIINVSTTSTGGILAATTYYYKITSVTECGESGPSTEVSITTSGSTSSNTISITDLNISGLLIRGFNIYRSTVTNTEVLVASINGLQNFYIDKGDQPTALSTTLTGAHTSLRKITVGSTAGLRSGSIVNISGVGNFTIFNVISSTQFFTTGLVTASGGTTVTFNTIPPAIPLLPVGVVLNTLTTGDAYSPSQDLTDNILSSSAVYSTGNVTFGYGAYAIFSEPAATVTNPLPTIGLIGDSIMNGVGYVSGITYRGAFPLALNDVYPYVNLSCSGELAGQFAVAISSRQRMAVLQGCKYTCSNYGTNDTGNTLSTIKSNILTIARMCIDSGVKTHFQCTLLPKSNSTDGWQTYANQTPVGGNLPLINAWLRAPQSAGSGNSWLADIESRYLPHLALIDWAANVETNASGTLIAGGQYWRVEGITQYATKVGTTSGGTSGGVGFITDSGQSWTTNQWQGNGYMISATTSGVTEYQQIGSNTATTINIVGLWTNTPTSGTTYYIYKGPTIDGTHPTDLSCQRMAAAIPLNLFI